jgi:CRP/FNR family cyclic AMP-dependent transcriptional regulator
MFHGIYGGRCAGCRGFRFDWRDCDSRLRLQPWVAVVVQRHNHTQADLVDQLFNSSEKRLARALLILARFGKEGRSEEVIPGVRQETLAEMIGTTRSRVNYFMNKFRKLGFFEYNGGLQVHSSLLSVVLHE